ncbi:uncharacterized protein Z520_01864 [Fonsecaea multimorphosa CBS 102226]|uniref:SUN domain-containing protein n=1 Tax=Fonsecaea multimorphosa CBS 102226 TaxID=1442371 RepID=A0A0D2HII0_9EURO|nr:uncharacterized protein Z520_01864 [Fonsecaea multimorphosa CBS 102226]KIY01726.1 hypothetical protein Z520_01864 [Fonsecaea multimorphosa CBS 102226]OAL29922.1 hypothetical protein AYO22_01828 [Fonsecaea multimorphosa]
MAPRRSTARGLSATPVRADSPAKRSTRAGSAAATEDAIPRRVTRGTSQQPNVADGVVNNPRLPEVQIQQSYAYGSSKTPVLPNQLVARSRMNLKEMAETIDAGVEQAQQHLRNHIEETHANLQKDSRAERARRRASREHSREASVASDDAEQQRTQRVAAWASGLDDDRLNGIPEEGQEAEEVEGEYADTGMDNESAARSTPDDDTNKETDPSSFPSGIFDHSYNYERGLRKPNITIRERQDPWFRKAWNSRKDTVQRIWQTSSDVLSSISDWSVRLLQVSGRAIRDLPNSPLVPIMTSILFALLFVGGASFLLCYTYTNFACDPLSTSTTGLTLQKLCGTCTRSPSAASLNLTANGNDLSKLTAAINNINQQLRLLETRLTDKLDTQTAAMDKDIEALKRQHSELSSHMAGLRLGGGSGAFSGDVPSPVIPKINYFAPNNGAMVEPRLTSPTMQKPLTLAHRVLLRMLLATRYVSKPPITALAPWQDVGDCWCASAVQSGGLGHEDDVMRLGVRVTEMIYPTEVVLENYPSAGSLSPGSTPKTLELWADFEHLDSLEWDKLNIRSMQGVMGSPFGPSYALIGRMEYDASSEASHVQAFPLDVNQASGSSLAYAAQNFVLRVTENYGAEFACLYRVRLHGVPVFGHGQEDDSEG